MNASQQRKIAAESEEIAAAEGITKDNVKREDKDALNKAKGAIEEALREFGGNYTQKEREELTKKLERINAALEAIGNAKRAAMIPPRPRTRASRCCG